MPYSAWKLRKAAFNLLHFQCQLASLYIVKSTKPEGFVKYFPNTRSQELGGKIRLLLAQAVWGF